MATWPANGVSDWNTLMKAFIDIGHNSDGTLKPFPYIKLVDSKSSSTVGGTATTNTWTKRTISEETDTDDHASVASSVIVLDAGTYQVSINSQFYRTDDSKIRLRNTTAGTTLLVGTSEFSSNVSATSVKSTIVGLITVAATQSLEIQYYVDTTTTTSDLGQPTSSGEVEIYTIAEFWKR